MHTLRPRIAIITEIISPYRLPVFNSLAGNATVEPHIIFLSETDPSLREWRVYKNEISFRYHVLPNWRRRCAGYNLLLNWSLEEHLEEIAPDVLICGGYNYLASWQALRWCSKRGVPLVLWSESTRADSRGGHAPVEFLKRQFLRRCSGFVVPGRSAFEYLIALNVPRDAIITAPNAVDNEFFRQGAITARLNAARVRGCHGLPQRFFLYCGRLTKLKGVFDALDAYAALPADVRCEVSFVFAGNGPEKSVLERRAKSISPGCVYFPGFVHREDLPAFYALADALVFPTHSDPWGLVVNEAMAAGLPIITTTAAGCALDLVQNGRNGFVVEPGSQHQLASVMNLLVDKPEMRRRFARQSEETIKGYSPSRCALGLAAVAGIVHNEAAYA